MEDMTYENFVRHGIAKKRDKVGEVKAYFDGEQHDVLDISWGNY